MVRKIIDWYRRWELSRSLRHQQDSVAPTNDDADGNNNNNGPSESRNRNPEDLTWVVETSLDNSVSSLQARNPKHPFPAPLHELCGQTRIACSEAARLDKIGVSFEGFGKFLPAEPSSNSFGPRIEKKEPISFPGYNFACRKYHSFEFTAVLPTNLPPWARLRITVTGFRNEPFASEPGAPAYVRVFKRSQVFYIRPSTTPRLVRHDWEDSRYPRIKKTRVTGKYDFPWVYTINVSSPLAVDVPQPSVFEHYRMVAFTDWTIVMDTIYFSGKGKNKLGVRLGPLKAVLIITEQLSRWNSPTKQYRLRAEFANLRELSKGDKDLTGKLQKWEMKRRIAVEIDSEVCRDLTALQFRRPPVCHIEISCVVQPTYDDGPPRTFEFRYPVNIPGPYRGSEISEARDRWTTARLPYWRTRSNSSIPPIDKPALRSMNLDEIGKRIIEWAIRKTPFEKPALRSVDLEENKISITKWALPKTARQKSILIPLFDGSAFRSVKLDEMRKRAQFNGTRWIKEGRRRRRANLPRRRGPIFDIVIREVAADHDSTDGEVVKQTTGKIIDYERKMLELDPFRAKDLTLSRRHSENMGEFVKSPVQASE